MTEVTALNKFPCPACGAEAVWNPARKLLVCPYCGVESPAEIKTDATGIAENDLMTALQTAQPQEEGWDAQKSTVRCQNCNAVSVFDAKHVAKRCDFCGSPALIAENDIKAPIRPAAVLPFVVADTKVREQIRDWYGSHWFAPNNLKGKALTDTLHGVYLPYWTFDGHAYAQWQADAGYYYYTTDDKGNRQRHTRWEPANGALEHFFDDLLICASKGVHEKLLREVEPFPTTKELMPYDPGYISGWVVEQYQIDLVGATQASRQRMDDHLRSLCASAVPGDTHRNLVVDAQYQDLTFKHVLLPIWLLSYTYGAKSFQVVVNGSTGKIAGEYPLSWVKITLATIAAILAFLIFMWIKGNME